MEVPPRHATRVTSAAKERLERADGGGGDAAPGRVGDSAAANLPVFPSIQPATERESLSLTPSLRLGSPSERLFSRRARHD